MQAKNKKNLKALQAHLLKQAHLHLHLLPQPL